MPSVAAGRRPRSERTWPRASGSASRRICTWVGTDPSPLAALARTGPRRARRRAGSPLRIRGQPVRGPNSAVRKVDVAGEVLSGFVDGGKYVRSTFMYLGWLCGAPEDEAALRASASLELLHAFALMQDDVMDESALRRGRPSAHVVVRSVAPRARADRLVGSIR